MDRPGDASQLDLGLGPPDPGFQGIGSTVGPTLQPSRAVEFERNQDACCSRAGEGSVTPSLQKILEVAIWASPPLAMTTWGNIGRFVTIMLAVDPRPRAGGPRAMVALDRTRYARTPARSDIRRRRRDRHLERPPSCHADSIEGRMATLVAETADFLYSKTRRSIDSGDTIRTPPSHRSSRRVTSDDGMDRARCQRRP